MPVPTGEPVTGIDGAADGGKRMAGLWKGKVWMHPDFDQWDAELESLFYEGPIEPAR